MTARLNTARAVVAGLAASERAELAVAALRGCAFSKSIAVELTRLVFAAAEDMDPDEVEELAIAMVAHLRAIRPEQVAPLGVLPDPTEPIRDPRKAPEARSR